VVCNSLKEDILKVRLFFRHNLTDTGRIWLSANVVLCE